MNKDTEQQNACILLPETIEYTLCEYSIVMNKRKILYRFAKLGESYRIFLFMVVKIVKIVLQ